MTHPEAGAMRLLQDAVERISHERTAPGVLATAVRLAPVVVPAAQHASVTVVEAERLRTAAATGPVADEVDAAQYEAGEGPCVEAARTGVPALVADLDREHRWPRFATRYRSRGDVRSIVSLPLCSGDQVVGALNLSAGSADAFEEESRAAATVLASVTVLALAAMASGEEATSGAVELAERDDLLSVLGHDLRGGASPRS